MTPLTKDFIPQVESPKFYGLPKIHKYDTPLSAMFPVGAVTY